jgi:2,4-dienoyl-CoA reductase-like NADH-dependent reductase (Old Yellow Enzyme family)
MLHFYEHNIRTEEQLDDDDIADLIKTYVEAAKNKQS